VARAEATAARNELDAISKSIKEVTISQQNLANQAFSSYCETLETEYAKADKRYDEHIVHLANNIDYEKK